MGFIENVNILTVEKEKLTTIVDNLSEITTTSENMETLISINENSANIDANADNMPAIVTNADNIGDINKAGGNIDAIISVNANSANIDANVDNMPSIVKTADNMPSIVKNADNMPAITTNASNMTNITILGDDLANQYSHIEDNGSITDPVEAGTGTSSVTTVAESIDNVDITAGAIDNVNANGNNINAIVLNAANITDIQNASENAITASTKANEALSSAQSALNSKDQSQLNVWEAQAYEKTALSYATEAEDTYVKIYTSNGDGTFTVADIAEYSALHWSKKSEAAADSDALLAANNLSDLSDTVAARNNLGLTAILNSVTASIANLATAQAVIVDDGNSIDIDTTQKLIPIMTDVPSTDTNIIVIDDANDTLTIGTNASVNFFSAMAFTSSTPNTRNVSIKVIDVADDAVLKCFDMALTIPNGTSDTVSHTFLLTVGKNGTPDAPLTVRFEIVADDTGYTLDSFRAVIATSSSYDVSTDASGITYDGTISGSTATNVKDALDEALNLDLGGLA